MKEITSGIMESAVGSIIKTIAGDSCSLYCQPCDVWRLINPIEWERCIGCYTACWREAAADFYVFDDRRGAEYSQSFDFDSTEQAWAAYCALDEQAIQRWRLLG